jgi:predicted nucleic acid-binding protein
VATFLDTNVLVYSLDTSESAKREVALRLLGTAAEGDDEVWISPQVVFEFFAVITRKLAPPVTGEDARRAVDALGHLRVAPASTAMMRTAVDLALQNQLSIWDAAIVSAAAGAGCTRILTEDLSDGQRLLGVRVENPFKPGWRW